MLGDPELKKCKVGDIIQLQRRGFFRVDNAYAPPSQYTGKASPVVLFEIPDGSQKSSTAPPAAAAAAAGKTATASSGASSADGLIEKIAAQGNLVRDLKTQKAEKPKIEAAVKVLLVLKADYKAQTGTEWTPNAAPVKKESSPPSGDLNDQITKQGNLVRDLKAQKADKSKIEVAVKTLLVLKSDFKTLTGKDWLPGAIAPEVKSIAAAIQAVPQSNNIVDKIVKQGDLVRDLKTKKAEKSQVDAEVKTLLALKAEYKAQTGQDYKPGAAPVASAPQPAQSDDIVSKIVKQGDLVRDLKTKKADKATVEAEVKTLLTLKAEYKAQTGQDYKPGAAPVASAPQPAQSDDIVSKIAKQGDLVRDLKTKKADKATVEAEVKTLLALKAEYKAQTGQDYKPGAAPVAAAAAQPTQSSSNNSTDLNDKIAAQGNAVRDLKAQKADKAKIDAAVKVLLALKADYKAQTGTDWTPNALPVKKESSGDLNDKIAAQGNIVRDLKAQKADKAKVEAEVKKLLALKAEYKTLTGNDWKPDAAAATATNIVSLSHFSLSLCMLLSSSFRLSNQAHTQHQLKQTTFHVSVVVVIRTVLILCIRLTVQRKKETNIATGKSKSRLISI